MANWSSDCTFFPEEPWRCDTIMALQRVAGSLSLIGCLLAIFIIWLFKRYTVVQQRMVLFIAISGAGGAISNIMGESEVLAFCKIIAFLNTFFDWSMLLWVLTVAIHVHLAIFWKKSLYKKEILLHCIIWPFSLIISLLPFFANKYGDSGAWCWIVHDTGWRMGIWYVPLFIVVIVLFVLYISGIIKIRSLLRAWAKFSPEVEENKEFLRHEVKPLIFYPLVYVVIYITPLANRIQNAIAPEYPVYTLVILAAISAASLGAANSLIYSLDGETRKKLRKDSIKAAWYSHFMPVVKIGEYDTNVYYKPSTKPEDKESIAHAQQLPSPSAIDERAPAGVDNPVLKMEEESKA